MTIDRRTFICLASAAREEKLTAENDSIVLDLPAASAALLSF